MRPRLIGKWRLSSTEMLKQVDSAVFEVCRYDGDVRYDDLIIPAAGKRAVIKQGMRTMSRSFLKESAHMDRERWIRDNTPLFEAVVWKERIYCQQA
jgi:hypothetical protein